MKRVLVMLLFVGFVLFVNPVSADDVELPVYDINEVSQLGAGYVGEFLGEYEGGSGYTISLLEVFKYPTIIATRDFGYFTYEYIPVYRSSGIKINKSVLYSLYQSGWNMKVWLFPHGFDEPLYVTNVYIVIMGQGLRGSANLYDYDVVKIENVPSLIISSAEDIQSAPNVELHVPPKVVNELIKQMPSALELKSNYKKAYKKLLSDYRNAETVEEKRKILFTYHYYLKPAYYITYSVYRPYAFIILQVENGVIESRHYKYQGKVNYMIPVLSKNYVLYYKMKRSLTNYNDFMLLKCACG